MLSLLVIAQFWHGLLLYLKLCSWFNLLLNWLQELPFFDIDLNGFGSKLRLTALKMVDYWSKYKGSHPQSQIYPGFILQGKP